jgi:glucose-6-phosphate 1-dehydrogenase
VAVPGYRQEPEVDPGSTTETYVALCLFIDNWRWAQVPFYLRAGKRLPKRLTEISLQFRDVRHHLFEQGPSSPVPNILTLRIQPDEGITLTFDAKRPGGATRIKPVSMDFDYERSFGSSTPEAYERLILDALNGDSTLFIRRDEVEAAWAWIDRLLHCWGRQGLATLPEYTAGTWGPGEADVLMAAGGRTWRRS